MDEKSPIIIRKVDIPATLLAIQPNTSSRFRARDFASYGSVRSAITRINQAEGCSLFEASTDDNGETFIVSRH
jgi:hypothetical protein